MEEPDCLRELPMDVVKVNQIPSQPFPPQQMLTRDCILGTAMFMLFCAFVLCFPSNNEEHLLLSYSILQNLIQDLIIH